MLQILNGSLAYFLLTNSAKLSAVSYLSEHTCFLCLDFQVSVIGVYMQFHIGHSLASLGDKAAGQTQAAKESSIA